MRVFTQPYSGELRRPGTANKIPGMSYQQSAIPLGTLIVMWVWRFVFLAFAGVVAAALAGRLGITVGLSIWAAGTAVACAASAVLLRAAPLGQFTWRNRLAGILLTSGARLGRGKLWPMTAVAWIVWV